MKNNAVSIHLSEDEFKRTEEAKHYGVLNDTSLFKILIKNGLDEMEESSELIFHFNKNQIFQKTVYKTKVVRLDTRQYETMKEICESTPFSMSSLAKYFIMPQVDKIVERKGWNYKP